MKKTKYVRLLYCILQFLFAYCNHVFVVTYLVYYQHNVNLHWIVDFILTWLFIEFCTGQYFSYLKDKEKHLRELRKKHHTYIHNRLKDQSTVADLHEPNKPF